jgi:uncharacterized repeat protein (TIGR03803 family)
MVKLDALRHVRTLDKEPSLWHKTQTMVQCGFFHSCVLGFSFLSLLVVSAHGDVVHYQLLKSFGSVTNDGTQPWTTLVQGRDGALYGTTHTGGSNNFGTIFKLNTDGTGYAVLHHFGDRAGDGGNPLGGLTTGSDGLLYGTTTFGGSKGVGTIFKLQPDGTGYAIIRNFTDLSDGSQPQAGLIEGSDGALYGATSAGPGGSYGGTAFVIRKDGTGFRVLHRFGPFTSNDGAQPLASLLEGSDGALYGTTSTGGGSAVGSVFKMNKDGSGYQKLYAFGFGAPVINPFANLLEGSDHALYGTAGGGAGGVFRLNKDGSDYRVLHGFAGDWSFAALVKGRDGALYSATAKGGRGVGTVFRLNEDGTGYEVLHTFGAAPGDGESPESAMVLGSDGALYGTTLNGGDLGRGTVFRLLVNRVPVVQCASVLVSADSNCVANASVDQGTFDPDGDAFTLVQSPPGPYPLGTNLVTLIATDSNGDSNECATSVIVLDTTPPSITCPSNVIVEFTGDAGAAVMYTVSAVDTCDPNPSVTSLPPSGGVFPIGGTEVHATATDASGNQSSCVFTVTVQGARDVKQGVLAQIVALRATLPCDQSGRGGPHQGTERDVCRRLDDAIQQLRASLDPAFWLDETHLETRQGKFVFDDDSAALTQLCLLQGLKTSDLPPGLLEGLISRILRVDRLLASVSIQDAISEGIPQQRIQQAQKFLAQGDADAQADPCGNAVNEYRQAWTFASASSALPLVKLGNAVRLVQVLTQPGTVVIVEASTNLVDWITIGTATANADGVGEFMDSEASNHAVRYYRAVIRQ